MRPFPCADGRVGEPRDLTQGDASEHLAPPLLPSLLHRGARSADLKSVCVVSAVFENGPCCQITGAEGEEYEEKYEETTTGYFPCVVPQQEKQQLQHHSKKSIIVILFQFFCFEMAVNILQRS